jgi:septal ring-binding cell division protein DamX
MKDFVGEDGIVDQAKVDEYMDSNPAEDGSAVSSVSDIATGLTDYQDSDPNENDTPVTDGTPQNEEYIDPVYNSDSEIDNYILSQRNIDKPSGRGKQSQDVNPLSTRKPTGHNPFRDNTKENTGETVVDNSRPKINRPKPKPITIPSKEIVPAAESGNNAADESATTEKPMVSEPEDVASNKSPDDLLEEIRKRKNSSTDKDSEKTYTVQVFSTLSEEDAELWREKLERRKVGTAYVSKHVIRDQTWYRVRVGEYPSREEALRIARKLGYTQVWVDRVK